MKIQDKDPNAPMDANFTGSSGFTLIETLMVIAILSVLFGTIYSTFSLFNRAYTSENVKAGVQQRTRLGMEFMIRDIRLAGLNPQGSAAAGINTAEAARIIFSADLNYDGDVDAGDPLENVTYQLVGSDLIQINHLGPETLLENVTGLTFTYLDIDDAVTADLDAIRTVLVTLTTESPAGQDGMMSRTYTSRVRCRNL